LRELASRLSARYAVLVIGLRPIAAGIGNLAAPQLERDIENHARSFTPAEPRVRSQPSGPPGFRRKPSNNLNYVVLEQDQPLTPQDRQFYDQFVATMRSDPPGPLRDGPLVVPFAAPWPKARMAMPSA
jgi:putative drug exporter of the RND superfamily